MLVERLGLLDPAQVRAIESAVCRIDGEIDRVGDVLCIELLAGVELHALANLEIEGRVVFPLPRRCDEGDRIVLVIEEN